jgi:mono/diheme cytochrome c family protein
MKGSVLITVLVLAFLIGAAFAGTEDEADTIKAGAERSELDAKVLEILGKSCVSSICHGGENPKMQMSLEAAHIPEILVGIPSKQNSELMLIDVKDPSRSYFLLKLTGGEGMKGKKMPVMKAPLTEDELAAIAAWVESIAEKAQVAPLSAPNVELHPLDRK